MVSEHHFQILGIEPGATMEEIKRAYHRCAKKTHPDLAPESKKDQAVREMMRINKAYMALTALSLTGAGAPGGTTAGAEAAARPGAASSVGAQTTGPAADSPWGSSAWTQASGTPSASPDTRSVGAHRDPAYVYYKRGFSAYQKGYTELFRRDPKVIRKQLQEQGTADLYILSLAIKAIRSFEEAYDYFLRVTTDYGSSPWAPDARYKLRRIRRFNAVYQRICSNISRNIKKGNDDAA
ncbi:MAG: DnaJ domain-containing protein [Spirochaetota bacterium]